MGPGPQVVANREINPKVLHPRAFAVSPMDPPVDSPVDPAVDPTVDLGLDSGMDLGLDSGMDFSWISHGFFCPILCRTGYYFGTEKIHGAGGNKNP